MTKKTWTQLTSNGQKGRMHSTTTKRTNQRFTKRLLRFHPNYRSRCQT